MALWLRHIMGASMFEIDLEEVFVSSARRYHPGKYMVNQSIHGKDVEWGEKVHYNINDSAHRIRSVDFNPGADYHVYGVQVDKQTNRNGIVVTFLLDGKVRSVWQSTSKFESLLKPENMPKGEDQVWDLAITGQMGGKYLGVSYPEDNPELKGKPVIIGHDPRLSGGRGVVSTCNYEARKYGVQKSNFKHLQRHLDRAFLDEGFGHLLQTALPRHRLRQAQLKDHDWSRDSRLSPLFLSDSVHLESLLQNHRNTYSVYLLRGRHAPRQLVLHKSQK